MSAEAWQLWMQLLSVWLAWHFQHLRLDLRGRSLCTYTDIREAWRRTYIDVRGSLSHVLHLNGIPTLQDEER